MSTFYFDIAEKGAITMKSKLGNVVTHPIYMYEKKTNGDGAFICYASGFYLLIAYNTADSSQYYFAWVHKPGAEAELNPIVVPIVKNGMELQAVNELGTVVVSNATNYLTFKFQE